MFMPKKLTILGALTAAVVFGYFGLFNGTNVQAGGSTFVISPAAEEIDVQYCYDTVITNSPNQAAPVPPAITGRVTCDPANPSPLPLDTAVAQWTVINLPTGNRLTLPTAFTPSGTGQWQTADLPCLPLDADNQCTAAGALDTGDITSRTDIGCNTPTFDVLGNPGGTGGTLDGWGNETNEAEVKWPMPSFDRIAQNPAFFTEGGAGSGEISGGPNEYVHAIAPFPSSWSFRSSDLAVLTALYLGSGGPATIPTSRLNLLAYQSGYPGQAGLVASAALLGGNPDTPPSDSTVICALQSPQDSISETDVVTTPDCAPGCRVVRWTTLQSDFDRADANNDVSGGGSFEDDDLTRILDWQCDVVGVPVAADADGDCDPAGSDPNDAVRDTDGDKVPDGVERAYASNPAVGFIDTDGDGCDDYCEIFQITDPNDTDTDNDGQADKPDDTPTNCIGSCVGDDAPTTGTDAVTLTDDNCPTNANADQLNTDSMQRHHGIGPSGAAGTGDATNPDEDTSGDACDTDADNDGIPGETEAVMKIKSWTGYTEGPGLITSVCVGEANTPNFATHTVMSDLDGDVDRDYILDGIECIYRSRPDVSIRTAVTASGVAMNCSTAVLPPVTGGGCAQPGSIRHNGGGGCLVGGTPATDCDNDRLYLPGKAAEHARIEAQSRTDTFNLKDGGNLVDVDDDTFSGFADQDSDRDVLGLAVRCPSALHPTCVGVNAGTTVNLQDGNEVWIYGTAPADTDTDQDGCPDGDEVNDITGDGNASSGDQGLMVSKFALGGFDNNADGMFDDYVAGINADLNKDGTMSSGDQGLLAAAISAPGSCTVAGAFVEDNVDVATLTKNLP
jgi:hypothetical protein